MVLTCIWLSVDFFSFVADAPSSAGDSSMAYSGPLDSLIRLRMPRR